MFASMDFWQSFLSPSAHSKQGAKSPPSPKLKKKKKKQTTPPKQLEQSKGKGHSWFSQKRSGLKTQNEGRHGNMRVPSNVNHKTWEVFNTELDQVTSWLQEAVQFTTCWQAPAHSIPSIRVLLERHLAFSLEVQTHQNQTERIVIQGHDIIDQSPDVSSSLRSRLQAVVSDWNLLERSLDIQAKQIKEALAVVETSINTGHKGSCNELVVEETRDAIEFMRMKLRRNQGRSSPVTVSISQSTPSHSRKPGTSQTPVQSTSRFSPANTSTSNSSSLSSTPEFEVLYNELSDWLNDMHLAVTDSADMRVSESHKQHMCKGYEQELQLREVSRSKLQRRGLQLMASQPRLTGDINAKLEALNQQWLSLQQHIAPSPLLMRKTSPTTTTTTTAGSPSSFSNCEQAMSLALEVEDVIGQLKTWLTQMEGRLFESDCSLDAPEVTLLETRLRTIQAVKDEIDSNEQSVGVVLRLCSLLQEDERYLSPHPRERESLQLGAINVERRWQTVRTQSQEILSHLQERVDSVKGSSSDASSGDEQQRSLTPDLPFIMEDSAEEEEDHYQEPNQPTATPTIFTTPSVLSLPETCVISLPLFQPSGAKDDDMVDGYGNRMHNQGRSIEYDDILVAREAFSENDAFSISDASEVSVEDFAFDDHLPLKEEEDDEEEVELDDDLVLPLSETPDIMELTDEMLDAYLQLEEEILQEVEEEEKTSQAAAALEFWSMSPREDHLLKAGELEKMQAALRESIQAQMIEEGQHEEGVKENDGEEEVQGEDDELSFEQMCSAYTQAITTLEEQHGRLDSVGSDFLSEEAEEALECMVSGDETGDDYDGDLDDDDCFLVEDAKHGIFLPRDDIFTEETQEFNDDFAGWMIGSMEDVAEIPDSLSIEDLISNESSEGKALLHVAHAETQDTKEEGSEALGEEEIQDAEQYELDYDEEELREDSGDDLPEIDADDSIFSSGEDAASSSCSISPPHLATWPLTTTHQLSLPTIEDSPHPFLSSLRSLSSGPEISSFLSRPSKLFPSLVTTEESRRNSRSDEQCQSPVRPFQARSLGQRRLSQLSNEGLHEAEAEKDNLLEITDISLSHMYESLDFVTELVHQIAPEESTPKSDQRSRFDSFSEAVERVETTMSRSFADSFDIVSSIVRKMVPSEDDANSVEEKNIVSEQTDLFEEMADYSQSEALAEEGMQEVEGRGALSDSLPLSDALWQDYMQTCAGSLSFTWPSDAACSESSELASIQAAVKQTLSNALRDDEAPAIMSEQTSRKAKKNKRNKRRSGAPTFDATSTQHDDTEISCAGSCDTGFQSLMSTDDEKSMPNTPKLTEVDSPCTLVGDDDEATPVKEGYMSYVSQIAEACSEGNLDSYLSTQKHKQCYLWSVPPPADDTPEEAAIKGEIVDLEKDVSDLLLTTEELECKWELNSQATDDTDRLIEQTSTLVDELRSGQGLNIDDIEEDRVGSWKDVIVLWMDKNGKVRDAETQGCTPFTVSRDYMHLEGSQMTPIIEEITATDETDTHHMTSSKPRHGVDTTDQAIPTFHQRPALKTSDACEQYEAPSSSKSYLWRVLGAALPIQVLLFVCTILILVLPTMVVTQHGDCYVSFTDRLMLDSTGPVMSYVRGPPPV